MKSLIHQAGAILFCSLVGCSSFDEKTSPPPKWATQPPRTLESWINGNLGHTRDEFLAGYGKPTTADVSQSDNQSYTYRTTVPLWQDARTGKKGNTVTVYFVNGKVREIIGSP